MIVKLLTEHHLEFLSIKGGCTCSSESINDKMPICWKSHATAHIRSSVFSFSSSFRPDTRKQFRRPYCSAWSACLSRLSTLSTYTLFSFTRSWFTFSKDEILSKRPFNTPSTTESTIPKISPRNVSFSMFR